MTPARITDPAVGASVCASGSHVCNGNSGTLTANAMANERNSHRAAVVPIDWSVAIFTRSNVSGPPLAGWWRYAVATIPTSMNAEPSIVYRKNLLAA